MARNQAFRERIYREYMTFFEKAERNRRWSVFEDIPWDTIDTSNNDENAALCAETFVGVESYLPDYVANGINVVRDFFGSAWFQANWGYEESKHALSLRMYLTKSGQRTEEQMFDYEAKILGNRWQLPFSTARQMTLYGSIQEQATFMMYRHQLELARERGDEVLAAVYQRIAKDEAAHADFYRKVIQLELEEHREDVIKDLAFVFANFRMPADDLVPDYETRVEVMRGTGVIDRAAFLKEVWFPTLRKFGVTRSEIGRASRALRANNDEAAAKADAS